jgi:hypothetical protein
MNNSRKKIVNIATHFKTQPDMKTRTLLFSALLILIPVISSAQLGNFIKNQASKAASIVAREADKEAARRADSIAQANAEKAAKETSKNIEESSKANQTQQQGNQQQGNQQQGSVDLSKFLGGKVDLKYNDNYSFTSRLYMQTETYDKQDVMKVDLEMFFSANTPSVGMETKTMKDAKGNSTPVAATMVMDGENKCFIILTDAGGTKMGIITPITDENSTQAQANTGQEKKTTTPVFTKTGNTKMIAGYKCDEYTYKDSEQKTNGKVWFTKDANLKIDKRGWQQTGMSGYYGYAGFDGGLIMGNEAYDESGKLKMKSETKEINTNYPHSIAVKGYTMMQMNSNKGQQKK